MADHPKHGLVAALIGTAQEAGMGVDELAVRWVHRHPEVAMTLIGISSTEHLRRNVALAGLPPLPDEIAAEIAAVVSRWIGEG